MRKAFISSLVSLAEQNPHIILLTGDLGYMALEPFADKFPDRFINVGVAEQNMIGVATGLAEAGYIPFAYSIATFASLRGYEFIRNGPILHQLPVRIVGVGGGYEYGHNGITHYGLEDLSVMRTQPGISVFAPADHLQTKTILESTWRLPGPIYYRLGKDEEEIPNLYGRFEIDKAQLINKGERVVIFAVGNVATEAYRAVQVLSSQGIDVSFYTVSSIAPSPRKHLAEILSAHSIAISVEAHFISGGLGSLLAEIIAEKSIHCKLIRKGVDAVHDGLSGSKKYMYKKFGLDDQQLTSTVLSVLDNVK